MKNDDVKETETITTNDVGTLSLEKTNGNKNELPMQQVDLNQPNLPDLDDAEVIQFDLNSDYWSPKDINETKRMYFDCIKISQVQDMKDKEIIIDLPCAFFFEKVDGVIKTVRNGSKRLVGTIENNNIQRGTPLEIRFLGKKKTKNGNLADEWSIFPVVIKIK